ncbi:MAG: hypothetical protein AB1746_08325 [Candidatus Zixiibacteriota bacterium]
MTWFEKLTGFPEQNPDQVRRNIQIDGQTLHSLKNGKRMIYGSLEIASLAELRHNTPAEVLAGGKISVREIVADVRALHADISNAGSMFQVASQFNLLEMVSPNFIPEQGVGIYEYDNTQGPACAIAAGAGTIYRNYFVPVNGKIGQSADNQIDCLHDLGKALGNSNNSLWQMHNGYTLASDDSVIKISERLQSLDETGLDELRGLLRVGIQWNTQVTLDNAAHLVSQAYCAALPVAYSSKNKSLWEDFARLILEASYEATLCVAILNWRRSGNNKVFLTLLGGGAFGNETNWIIDSMKYALCRFENYGLDVKIVSFGKSNKFVRHLVEYFESRQPEI